MNYLLKLSLKLKIYTTLGYIVSQIPLNLGHVFRFRIVSRMCRVVYIFNYKMFHQEASVGTIKMIKTACLTELTEYYFNVLVFIVVHIFNYKIFHQEASIEIKMMK